MANDDGFAKMALSISLTIILASVLVFVSGCCPLGFFKGSSGCQPIPVTSIYCPRADYSIRCSSGTFVMNNNSQCGCTGVGVQLPACMQNPTDVVAAWTDPNLKNQLCNGPAVPSTISDKCCQQYMGNPPGLTREIFHDCTPGLSQPPTPGHAAPKCWVSRTQSVCQPYGRPGWDQNCGVTDYYGLCFQACVSQGGGCIPGGSQCCQAGCSGGNPDSNQKQNLTCFAKDANNPSAGGTCGVCPQGQVSCQDKCITLNANTQCCVSATGITQIFDPNRQCCTALGVKCPDSAPLCEYFDKKEQCEPCPVALDAGGKEFIEPKCGNECYNPYKNCCNNTKTGPIGCDPGKTICVHDVYHDNKYACVPKPSCKTIACPDGYKCNPSTLECDSCCIPTHVYNPQENQLCNGEIQSECTTSICYWTC